MDRPEQTLSAVLDAGELLLTSGAEAARVEDTMRRLARAYGFVRADVLTITASMAVTVRTADDQVITQTRRILRRGTDMRCIEAVNELSREVCVNPVPPEELHARLEAIRTAPDKLRCRLPLAYLITSGSFAVFFGGTWRDGVAAMLCSMLLYVIGVLGDRISLQPLVLTMVSSAAMCAAATLTVKTGMGQNLDYIIIGNIMLLIPGIPFVNSMRDIFVGDTITGLLSAFEAVCERLPSRQAAHSCSCRLGRCRMTGEILLQIVMAMIGALGFGLLFHIYGSRLITIMLGAAVNWGVYLLAMQWYDNRVTAFFVSTLATATLAEVLARLLKAPVITLLVPMLVPLIPGGDLYYTTLALVQGDTAGFARYGTLFIEEAGAMAFGVILVACLV